MTSTSLTAPELLRLRFIISPTGHNIAYGSYYLLRVIISFECGGLHQGDGPTAVQDRQSAEGEDAYLQKSNTPDTLAQKQSNKTPPADQA